MGIKQVAKFVDDLDIGVGNSYRCNCPSCHGKNTFTVTNDSGNLLYNCYKAGCGVSGVRHRNMDVFTIKTKLLHGNIAEDYTEALRETFDIPEYLTTLPTDSREINRFVTQYAIVPDDVLYDVRQDRIVFTVNDRHGRVLDAVGRSIANKQPKWLRYASSPVPYTHGKGKTVVIVEDAISAYVVGEFFENATGMALLGTQLTAFHKWYLENQYANHRVIVALDPDALNKTIQIVKELRGIMSDVHGFSLKDDLKYADERDFKRLEEMLHG
jgi:hypothetical protein